MSAVHSKAETKIFGLTLGAEPKQVAALGGLLVVLAIVWWVMRDPGESSVPPAAGAAHSAPGAVRGLPDPGEAAAGRAARAAADARETPGGPRRQGSRQALSAAVKEFKPTLKRDLENPIDPTRTDPTIRFVALSKVQNVGMAGGGRSLFDFGPVAPTAEEAKVIALSVKPKNVIPIYGPPILPPLPGPVPPPPPPAIPLKFYGFVHTARLNERRAFFMENEDIYIASEGETIKKRYKLVKIGVNSAVLEDTQFKNNQQTIKLTEEAKSVN